MQLNHIGIAGNANIRSVRYLPTDLCATGFSGWTRSVGQSWRSMLPVLVIVVAAARGSTLRVEGDCGIPRLVRPFQRCGRGYELRCGQLYARTIAAFADRR